MGKNKEKVSNEKLEKVSGGFKDLSGYRPENIKLGLSDEEYKLLEDEGYIINGKLGCRPKHAAFPLIHAGYKLEEEDESKVKKIQKNIEALKKKSLNQN